MILSILAAGFHYLALGIGLGALFARGLHFRGLGRPGSDKREELKSLFLSNYYWGLAAHLWIITGLLRLFGGVEKTTAFYFHNPFFYIKMTLFTLLFALEIAPMLAVLKWKKQSRQNGKFPVWADSPSESAQPNLEPRLETSVQVPKDKLGLFIRLNDLELALLVIIPFVAVAMAKGIWLVS